RARQADRREERAGTHGADREPPGGNREDDEEDEADEACLAEQASLEAVGVQRLLETVAVADVVGAEVVDAGTEQRRPLELASRDAPEVVPVVSGRADEMARVRAFGPDEGMPAVAHRGRRPPVVDGD